MPETWHFLKREETDTENKEKNNKSVIIGKCLWELSILWRNNRLNTSCVPCLEVLIRGRDSFSGPHPASIPRPLSSHPCPLPSSL